MSVVTYKKVELHLPDRYCTPGLVKSFDANTYENDMYKLVKEFVQKQHNVLEVGACSGFISVLAAKRANRVVSVEANPYLMESLEKTRQANQCDNLTFVNCMLEKSDDETRPFYTTAGMTSGRHITTNRKAPFDPSQEGVETHHIPTKTIDTLEKEHDITFDTLVINVGGDELHFLQRHAKYLKRPTTKNVIIMLHGFAMNDPKFDFKCLCVLKDAQLGKNAASMSTYFLR